MTKKELIKKLEQMKFRRAWMRGVQKYAIEIVDYPTFDEVPTDHDEFYELIMNGAQSWHQYSYGACSLIFDSDIAERLCTKTELRQCHNGDRTLRGEEWLDVQAQALEMAGRLAWRTSRSRL